MAGGNYAYFSINELGEETKGELITPDGVQVCNYKTWLTCYGPGQRPGAHSPLLRVDSGELTFHGLQISAVKLNKGPRRSPLIFYCVRAYGQPHDQFLIGCGAYAFRGSEWIGIPTKTIQALSLWVDSKKSETTEAVPEVARVALRQFGWAK